MDLPDRVGELPAGAMIQPMRQPVTLKVLEAPLMVTVRSRMPGSVAMGTCSPSYRMCS